MCITRDINIYLRLSYIIENDSKLWNIYNVKLAHREKLKKKVSLSWNKMIKSHN